MTLRIPFFTRENRRRETRANTRPARLGSLRTVLLVLAVIPSAALLVLWLVATAQLAEDWQLRARQDELGDRTGLLSTQIAQGLQAERRLTAELLANPDTPRARLVTERERTDEMVRAFRAGTKNDSKLPREMRDALTELREDLQMLPYVRKLVDDGDTTQAQAYQFYTSMIRSDLLFHEALGKGNDVGFTHQIRPLTELLWAQEMIAREDALFTRAWTSGRLTRDELGQIADNIGAQHYLFEVQVAPNLSEEHADALRALSASSPWVAKEELEQVVLEAGSQDVRRVMDAAGQWEEAMDGVREPLRDLTREVGLDVSATSDQSVAALRDRVLVYSAIGLGGVLLVILLTVRLTANLRRRVLALRDEAARLESDLPAVLQRLVAGEKVDVDAEAPEIEHGDDELGQLGQALNQSRRRLLEISVRDLEQHQSFQRLLQRLGRRTQILIGLQLKKLDEMERRHEDPRVLEGLFDLDHLTARLRRYEENMVILGGGQPQRRWRQPVRMLDVLRAALGEVQDYRRVQLEVPEELWLSGRAVGPVVHVLAELMENATAFSKPPNPVETRAALVPRGIVVEIEDRGLGMEPEEYERCNRMMAEVPLTDMLTRADDVRLGLFVVARLASIWNLDVEFRPSVFGGTRVIVVIPTELVADGPGDGSTAGTGHGAGRPGGRVVREGPRTPTGAQPATAPAGAVPASPSPDGDASAEPAPANAASTTPEPSASRDGASGVTADGVRPALPVRRKGRAMRAVTGAAPDTAGGDPPRGDGSHGEAPDVGDTDRGDAAPPDDQSVAARDEAPAPLPKRVRQASLAAELRRPPRPRTEEAAGPPATSPERSGAAIGAFQRQSRLTYGTRRPQRPEDDPATGASPPEPRRPGMEDHT